MTEKLKLKRPGSSVVMRVLALGVLAAGVAGMTIGDMSPFEAGRLYMVAVGLYLISPVERLPKKERKPTLLLRRPRYLLGTLSVTFAFAIVCLQFVARTL
jgi:hypothetical protein